MLVIGIGTLILTLIQCAIVFFVGRILEENRALVEYLGWNKFEDKDSHLRIEALIKNIGALLKYAAILTVFVQVVSGLIAYFR